jgi:pimeloyl-ACP methyl ester carboxylesterase
MDLRSAHTTSPDGTAIGYVTLGDGSPLLLVPSWKTSVDAQLSRTDAAPFYEALTASRRLVMYDRRGVGSSQREVRDLSRDAQVADLEAVVAASGIAGPFDLLGDNDGCYIAIALAAHHPEMVRRLALWAPLVGGHDAAPDRLNEFAQLIRRDWEHALEQWSQHAAPAEVARRAFVQSMRVRVSADIAAAYFEWEAGEDVSGLLPSVRLRALVLNTRRGGPLSMGVASMMPEARFTPVDANPDDRIYFGGMGRTIASFFTDDPDS